MSKKILSILALSIMINYSLKALPVKWLLPSPSTIYMSLQSIPSKTILASMSAWGVYISLNRACSSYQEISHEYTHDDIKEKIFALTTRFFEKPLQNFLAFHAFTFSPLWLTLAAFNRIPLIHPVSKIITTTVIATCFTQMIHGVNYLYTNKNTAKDKDLLTNGWYNAITGTIKGTAGLGLLYLGAKS